jgi:ABC-type branched-subunit amino acid transport system permease subunit
MPLPNRSHNTTRPSRPASGITLAWPAAIVVAALLVFIMFWQTTAMMAVTLAVGTLVAGGLVLTLMTGTAWIGQLLGLVPGLGRKHR